VLIISPNKIPTRLKYKVEGLCLNNEAEYKALITELEILLELGVTRVEIMGDSELVIKQITKEYICIKENLIMYFIIVSRLKKIRAG
jgi:ribonuclease HI